MTLSIHVLDSLYVHKVWLYLTSLRANERQTNDNFQKDHKRVGKFIMLHDGEKQFTLITE